jgi:hypothetical protein
MNVMPFIGQSFYGRNIGGKEKEIWGDGRRERRKKEN